MILDSPYISGSTTIENSLTASNAIFSGNLNVTGDISSTGGLTGSLEGTASVALSAISSSHALSANNAISSSFAATSSFADSFTVAGEIVAQTLNVQQVTSSVVYSSGSNVFGNSVSNTQQFTGSLQVSGSSHYLLGNVGIGTDSPATPLHLSSNNGALARFANNSATLTTTYINVINANNTSNGTVIAHINDGTSYIGNQQNAALRFVTNDTERMRITSGGNVGIGTSTPVQKLHLYSTGSPAILYIESDASNNSVTSQISLGGVSPRAASIQGYREASSNLHALIFNTYEADPVERMRITSGGNVGIGTSSPSYNLHNTGTFGFATDITGNIGVMGANTATADTYFTLRNTAGRFDVGTSATGHYFYGVGALPLQFFTNATERMRIDSSGNVGIGTTSPGSILHLYQSTPILRIQAEATDSFHGIEFRQGSGLDTTLKQLPLSGEFRIANGRNSSWGGFITLYTDTVERLRITSGGNVGIGTTSPGAKLDVDGSILAGGNNSFISGTGLFTNPVIQLSNGGVASNNIDNRADIVLANNTSYTDGLIGRIVAVNTVLETDEKRIAQISFNNDGATNSGNITFATLNAGTFESRMSIRKDGKVGIGTTSPDQKLVVQGTDSATLFNVRNTTAGQYSEMKLQAYDTSYFIFKASSGYSSYGGSSFVNYYNQNGGHAFHTDAGNNLLYITNAGTVGINQTSPRGKFDVTGGKIVHEQDGSVVERYAGAALNMVQNEWYNVYTFNLYELTCFFLLVGFEDNTGDSNNVTAIFVDSGSSSYGTAFGVTRLTGSTAIEAQRSSDTLQVRCTQTGGTNRNLHWTLVRIDGT